MNAIQDVTAPDARILAYAFILLTVLLVTLLRLLVVRLAACTRGRKVRDLAVRRLIWVAWAAHGLAHNTEDNGETLTVLKSDLEELSRALDALDELPEPPGEAATGPRKAEAIFERYWARIGPCSELPAPAPKNCKEPQEPE